MPDPTKEQFDAAAQRVMATAPPGLSRDQFFAEIDKALAGGGKVGPELPAADTGGGGGFAPVKEPVSAGGFAKNAIGDAINIGGSLPGVIGHAVQHPIDTMTALPVGILNRIKQVGSDIHPKEAAHQLGQGNVMAAIGNILPVQEMYERPVSMAADIAGGASLAKAGKALIDAPGTLRQANLAKRVDRYTPNKSGYEPGKFSDNLSPIETPAPHPDPQFAPRGGEGAHNDAYRPSTPTPDPQESMYQSMMGKLNDKGGGPIDIHSKVATTEPIPDLTSSAPKSELTKGQPGWFEQEYARRVKAGEVSTDSPFSGDQPLRGWHSEAESAADKAQASTLHRETGDMDSRFNHLLDDESGMVPAHLPIMLTRMLAQEAMRQARGHVGPGRGVGRALNTAASAGKTAAEVANVSRMGSGKQ